jgi:2-amino-4-hydroxy-6-hydroxymethyldihydropteridine diphosphokinase/dihydropteroate synthase
MNLERAAQALRVLSVEKKLTVSPVYCTPALMPADAPDSWDIPFLNAVAVIEWPGPAPALLQVLKKVERDLGRTPAERWAPRIIDLDLLLYGQEIINEDDLCVPHPGMGQRSFVLDPLRDIAPGLVIPGQNKTVRTQAREVAGRAPLWMGIFNLTPDSFSDGGALPDTGTFDRIATEYEAAGVGLFDLGAESTRPGAAVLSAAEEWARLQPVLSFLQRRWQGRIFPPRLSIDTYRAETAEKALALGADCINDVSGLSDPGMVPLLRQSNCEYILMHSLSVPADKNIVMPENCDPVAEVRAWAEHKIHVLADAGIGLDRIIFDPGLGFGKTARQSLAILKGIEKLFDLPVRILVGHSRKSFINHWGERKPVNRDYESIAISLQMAQRGVDILRVHNPEAHIRAWRTFCCVEPA